ncbi:phosphopantetheine-binding protein [Amycolatopsis sp. NPDC003676]
MSVNTDVYEKVLTIVRQVARDPAVDPAASFEQLGVGSMELVHIVELVRSECGTDVWIDDAFDAADVASFARLAAGQALRGAGGDSRA